MKIALLFFGQPRELDKCYINIFNDLIRGYDVDIYAHLWWQPEMSNTSFHQNAPHIEEKNKNRNFFENSDTLFKELYEPKKVIFEKPWDYESFNFKPYREAIEKGTDNPISKFGVMGYNINDFKAGHVSRLDKHIYNELSQWYSVKKAFSLIEKDEYDFYIKFRTDLAIQKKIQYEKLQKDTLYISTGLVFGGVGGFLKSKLPLSDLAACGNRENMSIYCSFYDHYKDYIELPIHLQQELYLMVHNDIECDLSVMKCLPYWIFQKNKFKWENYEKENERRYQAEFSLKNRSLRKKRSPSKPSRGFNQDNII